jgi:hypothetical protein
MENSISGLWTTWIRELRYLPASGRRADENGDYPEGINYLVDERLEELARGIKEFEGPSSEEEEQEESAE